MSADSLDRLGTPERRASWIRPGTLVLLRWMAAVGQLVTIAAAITLFHVSLPVLPALLIVGTLILANLLSEVVLAKGRHLSRRAAVVILSFDGLQLAALLGVTGGLNNPFALLLLAPATIAATTLDRRATVMLAALTIALVLILRFSGAPPLTHSGVPLAAPPELTNGFAIAIIVGVLFLALYAFLVSSEIARMDRALLATQMALGREQRLSALTGVVAATAHELGTPLATIKLTSAELIDDLDGQPALQDDARLIRDQADRCRDILRAMGRAGKDDLHLRAAPLGAVLAEAAEPHAHRGIRLTINPLPSLSGPEPTIARRPELIHGLRNLVQNAVDFATAEVWIDYGWTAHELTVQIDDDGPGFSPKTLARIGMPFLRGRPDPSSDRAGYEGMGLGLFIAKTLLERTGAELTMANLSDPFLAEDERPVRGGASARLSWSRADLAVDRPEGLGENPPAGDGP